MDLVRENMEMVGAREGDEVDMEMVGAREGDEVDRVLWKRFSRCGDPE